jgi:hypothetical protein
MRRSSAKCSIGKDYNMTLQLGVSILILQCKRVTLFTLKKCQKIEDEKEKEKKEIEKNVRKQMCIV